MNISKTVNYITIISWVVLVFQLFVLQLASPIVFLIAFLFTILFIVLKVMNFFRRNTDEEESEQIIVESEE